MPLQTYGDWFEQFVDGKGGVFVDDNHGGGFKFMFRGNKFDNAYYIGHNYGLSELPFLEFDKTTLFKEPKVTFFIFKSKRKFLTETVTVNMYFSQLGTQHKLKMQTTWQYCDNKMYIEFDDLLLNRGPHGESENNRWTQYLDTKAIQHSREKMHLIVQSNLQSYGTFVNDH